jgi:hypothetical protein
MAYSVASIQALERPGGSTWWLFFGMHQIKLHGLPSTFKARIGLASQLSSLANRAGHTFLWYGISKLESQKPLQNHYSSSPGCSREVELSGGVTWTVRGPILDGRNPSFWGWGADLMRGFAAIKS